MESTKSPNPLPWSEIKKKREQTKALYSSIFKVPLIYGTKKNVIYNIARDIRGKVLDIGGGDRFVGEICNSLNNGIEYKSIDIDNSRFHDYYSFDDIMEKFKAVFLLDVLEHVSLADGKLLMEKSYQLLDPDGTIIVTIPNNLHPTCFHADCTHITSYRYHDLGGLLMSCGFKDTQIFRISAKKKFKHKLLALFLMPAMKFFDIDFATGILFIAKKHQ